MNVKFLVGLGLMLGLVAADVRAADNTYECVVKDSTGKVLIHSSGGALFSLESETYTVKAANAAAAQTSAIATANEEHNNRAATATCTEKTSRGYEVD